MRAGELAVATLIVSCALSSAPAVGGAASARFRLEVDAATEPVPLEGPIPVTIRVSYEGEGSVEILPLHEQFGLVTIQGPGDWARRASRKPRVIVGPFWTETLAKGKPMSRTLYLHRYFTRLTPGQATTEVTVKVAPRGANAEQPVVLRESVVLNVREPDPEGLEARLQGIAEQIEREQSAKKRRELYESVLFISHPAVVPILLRSLRDPRALLFRSRARDRVRDLCDASGDWRPVLDHLVQYGRQGDKLFFRHWQKRGFRLQPDMMERLQAAPSLWIRLYAVSMTERTPQQQGLISSLEAEAKELLEEIRALKEQRAQP